MNHVQASYLGFPCSDRLWSNLSWWKSFLKADNILNALSQLEIDQNLPNLIKLSTLEPFVVNTYGMSYTLFKANSNRYTYSLPAWNFGKHRFHQAFRGRFAHWKFFLSKKVLRVKAWLENLSKLVQRALIYSMFYIINILVKTLWDNS